MLPSARTLRIVAERKSLAELRHFVRDTLAAWQIPPPVSAKLCLAVDEAATNILLHGYQGQPGAIELELQFTPDSLTLILRDYAAPFDPTGFVCAELDTCLLDRLPGGLGIHLIREAVDELAYCLAPDGANELIMTKRLVAGAKDAGIP